ncbi:MAG: ribonuclease HII [Dethiobacter sp.]|jgi:ribonuclease HII|nr:MAG: ribonuclease HII [Dethiobacter sp.]
MKNYNNLSHWTVSELKKYLDLQEKLTPGEISTLKSDNRRSVQKLLSCFIQRREKELEEKKRLHRMILKEESIRERGYTLVAGVDEAGRGPLAGPVVAAAVILEPEEDSFWSEINDSKQLSPYKRETLYEIITSSARAFAVGAVNAALIDKINIYQASLEAMRLAVRQLWPQPYFLLSDGFAVPGLEIPQEAVKYGDALCLSIAAASIVAKVTRDRIMEGYDKIYPEYGFGRNKGYPTPEHKEAIKVLGLSPIHRRTFKYD